ncbi:shikimate kinase [Paeniglutamicibacter sp. ABSL32-1]|uniref:shikimate kinase n=1 Tax=Paeniglutamicibacter quisquiliarum TaxID=2849498 RepID=UPI001C2D9CE8|nr:shikimate kinase [Paeniglutamicibacter quisquiliarum]MBV1778422.1 shikimate kinase [Paeniglutamicibacter quisquiliarum]
MSTPIFLIGPMASGKSAVGALLARLLGTTLIDTDAIVVAANGPIPDIFAAHGEEGFRRFEARALAEAVRPAPGNDPGASPAAPAVVATGGGAVLSAANREVIASGFSVYLLTDAATVAPRIGGDTTRPLLGGTPMESWCRIFSERSGLYEATATLTIDTRGLTAEEIAESILTAYRDAGH